jgi:exopolysaccharide biosynthesis polyprenyl glycosylphosphotransferase
MSGTATRLIRRNWRQVYLVMALATDSGSLWIAAILAYWLRLRIGPAPTLTPVAFRDEVLMTWCLFIFFASVFGLYRDAYHAPTKGQHALGIKAFFFTIPAVLSLLYLIHWDSFSRGFAFLFFVLFPFVFLVGRTVLAKLSTKLQEEGFGTFNAIIIGSRKSGERVINMYKRIPQLGCRVKGIVDNGAHPGSSKKTVERFEVPHYPISRLADVIRTQEIDRVLVPSVDDAAAFPEILEICRTLNIDLKVLSPDFEDMWRFSFVHDVAGIPLYVRRRRMTERIKKISKRIFDILGSMIALILCSPILLIAAVAIVVEDGFPVFFRQKRMLARGKSEIEVLKFRSMKTGTEDYHAELLKMNKTTGGLLFVEKDPRVTRVGRVLRKFSIDEFPQLLRVFTGDMSLVGPRPIAIRDLDNISAEDTMRGFYELRSNAKPGMTGLWQISGRREVNFRDMVLLDLYYIENQSIMFDIEILLSTVPVVLFGKGAY